MPQFRKYKLLLDEGLPPRVKLPRVNSRHNLRHIKNDFDLGGISDPKVYQKAATEKRLLITFNVKDFKDMAGKNKSSGVIGVSQKLPTDQIDKKLNALLVRKKSSELYSKFNYISGETKS